LLAIPGLQARTHFKNKDVFEATAYSQTGITASGEYTHRHIVAADPKVLPLGTRIKIKWAGRYSGEYVVADTGAKIEGRRLDIYMPSTTKALKFGIRPVKVKIIELGKGTQASTRQSDAAVKMDVARDVHHGGVENAATKEDFAMSRRPGSTNEAEVAEATYPHRAR
jgi:3D (Asp-Asp-Asp) domain-containing protein